MEPGLHTIRDVAVQDTEQRRDEALLEKCIGGRVDVGQIRSQFESVFTYRLSWSSSFYVG